MIYPKQIMSISELVELGFPREDLKRYTRIKGVPAYKTKGGGKWLFKTTLLDAWIAKISRT